MNYHGGTLGELEIRKRASHAMALRAKFPYGSPAVLTDGGRNGRPRKEIIAPRAFEYRIKKPDEDIHFLVGHDYGKPIASKLGGGLLFNDTSKALFIDIEISEEMQQTSWVQDFMKGFSAGLILGISPGFRLPPKRAVANPETITEEEHKPEEGMHRAIIRTITAALLYEISAVTRPAYPDAGFTNEQIEARNWDLSQGKTLSTHDHLKRWRL